MGKLKFFYGTMGAGKTTEAIKTFDMYKRMGWKPLIVKPTTDTREGIQVGWGKTSSRLIDQPRDAYYVSNAWSIRNNPPKEFGVLIVDEAQFFSKHDICALGAIADDLNVDVICYGLKTDCNGNLFEGAKALLAIADEFKQLENLCEICKSRPAVMHLRYVNGDLVKDGTSVAVESDKVVYKSSCRKCFKKEWTR